MRTSCHLLPVESGVDWGLQEDTHALRDFAQQQQQHLLFKHGGF